MSEEVLENQQEKPYNFAWYILRITIRPLEKYKLLEFTYYLVVAEELEYSKSQCYKEAISSKKKKQMEIGISTMQEEI